MKTRNPVMMLVTLIILNSPFTILSAAPFSDNGDGTVTDTATNLRWQECSAGQSGTSCAVGTAGTYTWQNALSYCNTLVLASKIWRLPSVNELKSLIDQSKATGAAIDTAYFPATVANYYWASTTYAPSVSKAYYVYFVYGLVYSNVKTSTYNVRCVSAGP